MSAQESRFPADGQAIRSMETVMDVQGASLGFSMSRSAARIDVLQERLPLGPPPPPSAEDRVSLSTAAPAAAAEGLPAPDEAWASDPQLIALVRMIERITGRAVRLFDLQALRRDVAADPSAPRRAEAAAWEYRATRLHAEFEQTTLRAEGVIRTADGLEVAFALELSMSRSYLEQTRIAARQAAEPVRKDPLVVNFAGTAAQLTDSRFRFDLDADGRQEALPALAAGSGWLVFDRNGNGRVDDGRELFGVLSGDGFADLAALDGDGDGWVDAADADFARLQLWRPDAAGAGDLQSLAEAGVAALATARIATPFALRGEGNSDLGAVRSTGLFLGAAQTVGTVQQLDLTV